MHDYVCVECKQACVSRKTQWPLLMEHPNCAHTPQRPGFPLHLPYVVQAGRR